MARSVRGKTRTYSDLKSKYKYKIKSIKWLGRSTRILLYSSSMWYLGEGMIGPIFGVLTQRIGGDILDISWIWASYLIVAGIFTIIVGKISDEKVSKEKLLVGGYALNAVFTFCYLFASSPAHLFFVQAGIGVATALATPTWDALYAQNEDKRSSGYIWGLAGGQEHVITGIAIIVGGLIVNYWSFTALFITMGVVQTIATIYVAQILQGIAPSEKG